MIEIIIVRGEILTRQARSQTDLGFVGGSMDPTVRITTAPD
jgi:hypothetical protein